MATHLFRENAPRDPDAALAQLPVLDLAPFLRREDGALAQLAEAIRLACEATGFFYIRNHGVPDELIHNAFAQSRRFHALPLAEKQKIPQDAHNIGYLPINASMQRHSTVHQATKPNQNESYFVTHDRGPDHPDVINGTPLRGGNYWPADLPGFREGVMAYFNALNALGQQLVPAFALALGMPADWLDDDFADENNAKLRMLHYPPTRIEDNDFGTGPHTDNSFLTILARDSVPGLAIRLPTGEWLAPPVLPGTFLVNIGNILRRMSNDRFLSTPHGVIVDGETDRYAMAYFHSPNVDRVIRVASSCVDTGNPAKYDPVPYRELITEYSKANYFHQDGFGQGEIRHRYK
ncbi:MAG: hypothetical protein O3B08_05725 [Proteobacteria bacterium]|nr:hypothetical protein [Pseudomonadota bacterium]